MFFGFFFALIKAFSIRRRNLPHLTARTLISVEFTNYITMWAKALNPKPSKPQTAALWEFRGRYQNGLKSLSKGESLAKGNLIRLLIEGQAC